MPIHPALISQVISLPYLSKILSAEKRLYKRFKSLDIEPLTGYDGIESLRVYHQSYVTCELSRTIEGSSYLTIHVKQSILDISDFLLGHCVVKEWVLSDEEIDYQSISVKYVFQKEKSI